MSSNLPFGGDGPAYLPSLFPMNNNSNNDNNNNSDSHSEPKTNQYSGFYIDEGQEGDITRFKEFFRCVKMSEYPGLQLESKRRQHSLLHGDNLIIPQVELEKIMRENINLPITVDVFVLSKQSKSVTAVVTDFTSNENKAYFPDWVVDTVGGRYNCLLRVQGVKLPPGTYVKLKALDNEFMTLYDPHAVISYHIRNNFRTLTQGKEITIVYLDRKYRFLIEETKPESKIAIYETNLELDLTGMVTVQQP